MRLQERPAGRPGTCAVIPGRGTDPEGFVRTGTILPGWDCEVTISVTGVRELARTVGLPTREAHQALAEERDVLLEQVAELSKEVEGLSRFADAIHTIESRDFRARRKPGRKPQEKEKVTA